MKILQVLPYAECGGTEKAVSLLSEGLTNRNHDITVFSPKGPGLDFFSNVEFLEMPLPSLFQPFRRRQIISKIACNFDLIHIHAARELVSDYGIPVVFTPHSYYNKFDALMVSLFAKKANIICFTNWESSLLQGLGVSKTHVIPNGIKTPSLVDKRENYHNQPPKIGYLGRLEKDKGLDILLTELAKVDLPYELLIAGTGTQESALKKLAKKLKIPVKFLGLVSPFLFLQTLDIFVLPSRTETFGLALVEAMASRLACVTSNVCGLSEIVADAGICVPHNQLSSSITTLLTNEKLRKQLGDKAVLRFQEHYTADKMVAATEDLYCQLVSEAS